MRLFIFLLALMVGFPIRSQKPDMVVQIGHVAQISAVTFSPDGKYILTGSLDNTAKLWDINGRELRTFSGHTKWVVSVAFSPDGKYILTGSNDETAILWDLSGRELKSFSHKYGINSVAFSPDGKTILTGGGIYLNGDAKLWDLSGRELRRFAGHSEKVSAVAFSPDGQLILTGSSSTGSINSGEVKLWDINGQELKIFFGHSDGINSVAFSPDGQHILTGSKDHTASLWDLSGRQLQKFTIDGDEITAVAFSPDGQLILTGSSSTGSIRPGEAKLWDINGRELKSFSGHSNGINSVAFSPDGQHILTGSQDKTAKLWDISGQEMQNFSGHIGSVLSVAFSPDGTRILTGNSDSTAKLWGLKTREVQIFAGHKDLNYSVAFSSDGKRVLTGSLDNTAKLWDLNGQEIQSFSNHDDKVFSVAFSPDGRYILTGGNAAKLWDLEGRELKSFTDGISNVSAVAFSPIGSQILTGNGYPDSTATLWDLNGKKLVNFFGHRKGVYSVAFSPDGMRVLTGSFDNTAKLWDLDGREIRSFSGHSEVVISVAFSPNGRNILTGSLDHSARLWNTDGQELRSFNDHGSYVHSVAFSPDGMQILTGSSDKTTKIWDIRTGQLIATLYGFDLGYGWVVTTPDGRFDGDEAGLKNIHYLIGLEAIPLDRLKERYYEPGLLSKVMGFDKEPLRDVSAFEDVALYPTVALQQQNDQLSITLTERSGGMGRTALFINGSEKIADLNPRRARQFTINLKDYQTFYYADQPNIIGIKSYNKEGWLGSELQTIDYRPAKPVLQLNTEPHIFALCIGTADYARGPALDLAYAEEDALRMAQAIQSGGQALLNDSGKVEVITLSTCLNRDCPDIPRPTKNNIRAVFDAFAKKARPEDVFMLYLSGHGKVYEDYFYYLTQDMGSDYLGDNAIRQQYAISSAEFAEWLNAIPARKQVMMIDACASGQFNKDLALLAMKNIPSSQIRALDRLRDRTGIYIISGSANDQASYEASPYGMGLLTYSLLSGMSGGALREDEYMDVEQLFQFAEEQVPVLAEDVGAIQTPKFWKPEGSKSFDIGRATPAVREKIQLPSPKPVFGRVSFQDDAFGDALNLEATLNALLRDFALAKGKDKALLFVDADNYPNAYRLRGKYSIREGKIRVEYNVFKGIEKVGDLLVVEMASDNLEALGRKIISTAYEVSGRQ